MHLVSVLRPVVPSRGFPWMALHWAENGQQRRGYTLKTRGVFYWEERRSPTPLDRAVTAITYQSVQPAQVNLKGRVYVRNVSGMPVKAHERMRVPF